MLAEQLKKQQGGRKSNSSTRPISLSRFRRRSKSSSNVDNLKQKQKKNAHKPKHFSMKKFQTVDSVDSGGGDNKLPRIYVFFFF